MDWRGIVSFIAAFDMLISGLGIGVGFIAAAICVKEATSDLKISDDEWSKNNRLIMVWLLGYFAIHFWTACRLIKATEVKDADKGLSMSKNWQRVNLVLLAFGFLFVTGHILVRVGFLVRVLMAYAVWRFDCQLENGM